MSTSPTVSVVLIFYNDERFLPEAIESVFAQTYTDWELLLADDGSTDGSTAIARSWAEEHQERVRYLEHQGHTNRGPSATRNLGWRASRGDYLALLDSDDVWEPEKLTEQLMILEKNPEVGLVAGASLYWWSWQGPDAAGIDRVVAVGAPQDALHRPPALLRLLHPLGKGNAPCPSSCLVQREVLERIGGFEEQFRTIYEDQAFLVKVYHETPVWISSRQWDRYRRHPAAAMLTTSRVEHHRARGEFLSWYGGYLKDHDPRDRDIWRLFHRAWWPYRHPRMATARRSAGRLRHSLRQRASTMRRRGV